MRHHRHEPPLPEGTSAEGLVLSQVEVTYRMSGTDVHAVRGVSFEVHPGEVVGLVGESGCGKSTLAKVICGLVEPSAGGAWYNGRWIPPLGHAKRPAALRSIQMVFQNPYASLNPRRTIGRQIEDARRVSGRQALSSAELLQQVELSEDVMGRFPREFSGGQRQRIAIARAMAASPTLLIGDEPIASLDASLQAKTAMLMRDIALENGASLLFISHDLSVVRLIADRIVVMEKGVIVESGPTEQLWENPREQYTQDLLAAIPVVDGEGHLPAYGGK